MASKRVSKSAVDWLALQAKVPANQKEAFRALKSHSDKYLTRVAELPETLPKIDFAEYRRRVANTAFVDEYEKLYNALDVPYPKDPGNQKEKYTIDEKNAMQRKDAFVAESEVKLKGLNEVLSVMESIPPPEKMTMQMYNHYFPDAALNPNRDNPGVFPQYMPNLQMDHPEREAYINTFRNSRYMETLAEWEEVWRIKVEKQKADKAKQIEQKKPQEKQ